ncbi:RYamide neuropeptides-like [Leguminivora glycinivorella]|uniref:RYamide neuropeptides-like n=1 Tax=Leguminivora glycinivorella TaxID=1035111 RepID=UPI00200E4D90|nr:RYamide neuropeptides-like [Leguminivora glycinivorella]
MSWVVWCAAAALCACAVAEEKRAEMSPLPFVLGSRYGRSPGPAGTQRLLAPRNDRFFMGSRYGKRSEPDIAAPGSHVRPLLCEYTGVSQLYRCERAPPLDRRSSDEVED